MLKRPARTYRINGLAAALILLATVGTIHACALRGGWRFDDHYQLIAAQTLDCVSALTDPTAWRQFSPIHYTPWLAWMYRLDSIAFGLDPVGHYAHLLASLWVVAWFTFRLLRPLTGGGPALLAAIGTIAGAPAMVAARYLPGRHYVDGLAFALLAILCQRRWEVGNRPLWLAASAGAGLCALFNKEVFLPLCAVLPLLGPLTGRQRIVAGSVHGAIAVGFLVWRSHMLGEVVGGYGNTLSVSFDLATLAFRFPLALVGRSGFGIAATVTLLLTVGLWLGRNRPLLLPAAAIGIGLIAPFLALPEEASAPLPSAELADMRLYWMPGAVCWASVALAVSYFRSVGGVPGMLATAGTVLFALSAVGFSMEYARQLQKDLGLYDQQNTFISTHGPADVLLPVGHFLYWGANAREAQLTLFRHLPARLATGWHDIPGDAERFWQYNEVCGCIREIPRAELLSLPDFRVPRLGPLALSMSLRTVGPNILVELGPAANSAQFFGNAQGWANDPKPAAIRFPIPPPANAFPLRFSRQVSGAIALSPPIYQPRSGETFFQWQKGIFVPPGQWGTPAVPPTLPRDGQCTLDEKSGANGNPELIMPPGTPLALFGMAKAPDGSHPAAVFAALSQNERIRFIAPVYRLRKDGTPVAEGAAPTTEFGIADADLSAAEPGKYDLEVLQVTPEGAWRCDLRRRLHITRPIE